MTSKLSKNSRLAYTRAISTSERACLMRSRWKNGMDLSRSKPTMTRSNDWLSSTICRKSSSFICKPLQLTMGRKDHSERGAGLRVDGADWEAINKRARKGVHPETAGTRVVAPAMGNGYLLLQPSLHLRRATWSGARSCY